MGAVELDRGLFIAFHRAHGDHIVLSSARTQVIVRSRYAEDRLADAARAGVVQYVILGAGLDMFAYRSPLAAQVQTFEVDQPAAQRRKRQLLSRAGITPPGTVTFVAVDLEAGRLVESLVRAGFD